MPKRFECSIKRNWNISQKLILFVVVLLYDCHHKFSACSPVKLLITLKCKNSSDLLLFNIEFNCSGEKKVSVKINSNIISEDKNQSF